MESYHRHKYFISFVDDYSGFSWITLLRQKLSAINALKDFLAMVLNQYGRTIKEWMLDAGGEYKSVMLQQAYSLLLVFSTLLILKR